MNVKESLKRFEAAILEDGRVDRAEAQVLLAFARPLADGDPEMAGFVELLEKVLEDVDALLWFMTQSYRRCGAFAAGNNAVTLPLRGSV